MEGFAVDADENIYLGYMNRIDVYHDGELLRIIDPPTNKGYILSIEDDKLLIGQKVSNKIRVYDLYGNFLEDSELSYYTLKETVRKTKVIEQNGKAFTIHNYWGMKPLEVKCDGVVVYKMSSIDYIFNGLPSWVLLSVFFVILFFMTLFVLADKEIQEHVKRTGMRHL